MDKFYKNFFGDVDFENIKEKMRDFLKYYFKLPIDEKYDVLGHVQITYCLFEIMIQKIQKYFSKLKDFSRNEAVIVGNATFSSHFNREIQFRRNARYSYVSESGTPMIGDINFISFNKYFLDASTSFKDCIGIPYFKKPLDNEIILKLDKLFKQYNKCTDGKNYYNCPLVERIFLGNSSKILGTKKRIIASVKERKSLDEIMQTFRGVSEGQVNAIRAHVTMRTYDQIVAPEKDYDKITKEDAIDLLSSGIPVNEVHESYPTSFSLGQLRAFKAHVTMKTYNTS